MHHNDIIFEAFHSTATDIKTHNSWKVFHIIYGKFLHKILKDGFKKKIIKNFHYNAKISLPYTFKTILKKKNAIAN